MLSHFSPLAPFWKDKGDFAVCGQRPKGAALWKPATFEKVDETLTIGFICATFFVMPLFLQAGLSGNFPTAFLFKKSPLQKGGKCAIISNGKDFLKGLTLYNKIYRSRS
ncbi:MAG: hypothetical protein PUH30_07600 [Oscillospiraceae bacterium]|nr:hypothetical protein [Oscillospiraceae bacterium]